MQHTPLSCASTCWKRLILGIETHWWLSICQPRHSASCLVMQEIRRHANSIWNPSAGTQHKILQGKEGSKKDQHALRIHEWIKSRNSSQEEALDRYLSWKLPSHPSEIKEMFALPQASRNSIKAPELPDRNHISSSPLLLSSSLRRAQGSAQG